MMIEQLTDDQIKERMSEIVEEYKDAVDDDSTTRGERQTLLSDLRSEYSALVDEFETRNEIEVVS